MYTIATVGFNLYATLQCMELWIPERNTFMKNGKRRQFAIVHVSCLSKLSLCGLHRQNKKGLT